MRKVLAALLFSLVFLWVESPLSAQRMRWDAALDQYERICDECIDLRDRLAAGESVSTNALAELLSRLKDLRFSLQQAQGDMSPAQRERFNRIRDRYLAPTDPRRTPLTPLATLPFHPVAPAVAPVQTLLRRPPEPVRATQPSSPRFNFGCTAFVSLPEAFPGLMVLVRRKEIGGYLKGTASFSPQADYDARSDGTVGSALLWTTGREKYTQFSLSGGLIYAPGPRISFYAGAGYGKQDIRWEDASGKWARITDLSSQGMTVDAGILLTFGHLILQGGAVLREQGRIKVETGIGWLF